MIAQQAVRRIAELEECLALSHQACERSAQAFQQLQKAFDLLERGFQRLTQSHTMLEEGYRQLLDLKLEVAGARPDEIKTKELMQ